MIQAPAVEEHVKKPAPQRAERRRLRNPTPEALQVGARSFRPPLGMTIDQHGGIHRAGRSARDAVDLQPGFLQQPIKSTPGKGAVRPATLQCEVDEDDIAAGAVGSGGCHWASSFSDWTRERYFAVSATMPARLNLVQPDPLAAKPGY